MGKRVLWLCSLSPFTNYNNIACFYWLLHIYTHNLGPLCLAVFQAIATSRDHFKRKVLQLFNERVGSEVDFEILRFLIRDSIADSVMFLSVLLDLCIYIFCFLWQG